LLVWPAGRPGKEKHTKRILKKCLSLTMTYIVNPRNKKEEKVLETILRGLSIGFYSEKEEDAAILKAMIKGRKTRLLKPSEKQAFLQKLKTAK
jgi:hypothetical protein